jgi:hypothetical protein
MKRFWTTVMCLGLLLALGRTTQAATGAPVKQKWPPKHPWPHSVSRTGAGSGHRGLPRPPAGEAHVVRPHKKKKSSEPPPQPGWDRLPGR